MSPPLPLPLCAPPPSGLSPPLLPSASSAGLPPSLAGPLGWEHSARLQAQLALQQASFMARQQRARERHRLAPSRPPPDEYPYPYPTDGIETAAVQQHYQAAAGAQALQGASSPYTGPYTGAYSPAGAPFISLAQSSDLAQQAQFTIGPQSAFTNMPAAYGGPAPGSHSASASALATPAAALMPPYAGQPPVAYPPLGYAPAYSMAQYAAAPYAYMPSGYSPSLSASPLPCCWPVPSSG